MSDAKSKEILLKVLDLLKNMPLLWDRHHKDYKNKRLRQEANMTLLELYKKFDDTATIPIMTKKLGNLRSNYIKELKKIRANQLSSGEPYTPTLWYFDAFSFLKNIDIGNDITEKAEWLMSTSDQISVEPSDVGSSEEINTCDSESDDEDHITQLIVKEEISQTPTSERVTKRPKTIEDVPYMSHNDCDILGKSIAIQLRDLNKKQLTVTQKLISDTIYYAKLGMLSENSFVAVGARVPGAHREHGSVPSSSTASHTVYLQEEL